MREWSSERIAFSCVLACWKSPKLGQRALRLNEDFRIRKLLRGAAGSVAPAAAAVALAMWPARATVRAETVGRAVGRRRTVDCVARYAPAKGSLLLTSMYQHGRFARHRNASTRSRCASHPPRSQHVNIRRKTMATETAKWFSDDNGSGPGRRVQHRRVGHLPAYIRR